MKNLLHYSTNLADQFIEHIELPISSRVAYIVSHGQSYACNGYAIRTQNIAQALNQHGFETFCFVRPGRPWELGFKEKIPSVVDVQGVHYVHGCWQNGLNPKNEKQHLEFSVEYFTNLFKIYRPSVVLAASNYIVGLPAWVAARRLGLPFYNEVRGFWELSKASREEGYSSTESFESETLLDSFVARQAEKVFTLNSQMKDELLRRKIDPGKVELVPNALSKLPEHESPCPLLKDSLGIEADEMVIGYLGSFSEYEGVDLLVDACRRMIISGRKIKLLLVGDKQSIAGSLGGDDQFSQEPWLIKTGRVPQEDISRYYALVDVVVIPRKRYLVSEIVPPMKIVEALSYGKPTIVSDLPPLSYYSSKSDMVHVFSAGSVSSLFEVLCQVGLNNGVSHDIGLDLMFKAVSPIVNAFRGAAGEVEAPTYYENFSPLKKYSKQDSLESNKQGSCSTLSLKETKVSKGERYEITKKLLSNEDCFLHLMCVSEERDIKGAVADVTFFDSHGAVLQKPYSGMASSKKYDSYFYVEVQEKDNASFASYKIATPSGADSISVKLFAFAVPDEMHLIGDVEVLEKEEFQARKSTGSKYISSFQQILSEAEEIPDSNGTEYFEKHDYRVGVIGDVYMFNFYKDVFSSVTYLNPSNYKLAFQNGLDLIIYTTCWKGVKNEEWKGVKFREKPKKALDEIISLANNENIKTVFQSIEDPSNFEYFLPVAKKFDYVFTTDEDCIESYKKALGHDNVYFGEYGVNPQFNNPIGSRRNIRNAAFFAGSYPRRYKERCDDMETIFDSIIESGGELLIADRNFEAGSEELAYPERFRSSVLPPVRHDLLQKLHKLFRYSLNFNSIKQSPTMCAMRIYELQAQGNGLISNYANSVFNKFPGVRLVPYKQNMARDFSRDEDWEEYFTNTKNIREVLNDKTSYQVVSRLLCAIGLDGSRNSNTKIAVICGEKSSLILSSFSSQKYADKVLISESELSDWQSAVEKYNIGYFCWFSESHVYGENYLNDMLNAFKYTDSNYITKNAYFEPGGGFVDGAQHEYTNSCSGKALSLFSCKYHHPMEFYQIAEDESFELKNGYSSDPFEINFVQALRKITSNSKKYLLSVIVPVYNNGSFLLTKCIPSLRRNDIWQNMEVHLVDDGSNDNETLKALAFLGEIYPNVRVMYSHDGGSGSASRPRNQGIEVASSDLVTFLDPDNEIAPGAYDLLFNLFKEANEKSSDPVQFVSGFHVKVGENVKTIGKHTSNKLSLIKDFKKGYFDKGRFPVVATQSAVISKDLLKKNNIRFVESSAGQDTLFGWEVIASAECGGFNGDAYIVYYADRSDSITNRVDVSYFQKKLILEERQKRFLEESNLLESYLENKFDQFMNDWYLDKLSHVDFKIRDQCIEVLRDICSIYGKDLNDYI
ncbi:glycosyltransferase [Salinicola sp. DM10]|uniref:glycosyltransferase n=1 Tax=Salinicola sp. DM10 TaxID=2815721 RepID=UPI001E418DF2|nr:glycosyltransferase [Salinicola sp. DM10]MCE3026009.1 glycosyltransferase [Salinicola sp. DM10]